MEPTQNYLAAVAEAPRRRSRLKAALAGLGIAGMLTTWGAASVLAASPDPSASPSTTTTTDDSSGTTEDTGDRVCPNEDTTDSATDATSS